MQFGYRALLGLVLLACASFAHAQQVNVSGTARGIPFADNCSAANGATYAIGAGGFTVNFSCNGIGYSCAAQPLPGDPEHVLALVVGTPSRMKLNCGSASSITGLQNYVADFYASLQQFIDTPPPAGGAVPDRWCLSLQGSTISAINYDPASHLFSFTCTTGANSVASSCYMTSTFGYDAGGGTLIVPDCIDATDPLQSPYLFEHGYEGIDT
ncbi:MAG TPA: hypothetical protein VFL14_00180 [Xanthomonadales bacterium]|nr:hypothetical protein [Xanthomonadales bacterium]